MASAGPWSGKGSSFARRTRFSLGFPALPSSCPGTWLRGGSHLGLLVLHDDVALAVAPLSREARHGGGKVSSAFTTDAYVSSYVLAAAVLCFLAFALATACMLCSRRRSASAGPGFGLGLLPARRARFSLAFQLAQLPITGIPRFPVVNCLPRLAYTCQV